MRDNHQLVAGDDGRKRVQHFVDAAKLVALLLVVAGL
jgi:hypothetical protein